MQVSGSRQSPPEGALTKLAREFKTRAAALPLWAVGCIKLIENLMIKLNARYTLNGHAHPGWHPACPALPSLAPTRFVHTWRDAHRPRK